MSAGLSKPSKWSRDVDLEDSMSHMEADRPASNMHLRKERRQQNYAMGI